MLSVNKVRHAKYAERGAWGLELRTAGLHHVSLTCEKVSQKDKSENIFQCHVGAKLFPQLDKFL